MNRLQKMAWFNLAALAVLLTFSGVFLVYAVVMDGAGNITEHLPGLSSLWLVVILVVMVLTEWWAKRQRPGQVEFDERDRIIQIKALHLGILALFGVVLWMWWLIVPSESRVSFWIPVLLGSAAMTGNLVYSIAILVQYGWRDKGEIL